MRLRCSNLIAFGSVLAVLAGSEVFAASKVSVTDLGAAATGLYLNNPGQVAGLRPDAGGKQAGFLYSGGQFSTLAAGVQPIAISDGGKVIDARGPYTFYQNLGNELNDWVRVQATTAGNSQGVLVGLATHQSHASDGDQTPYPVGFVYQPLATPVDPKTYDPTGIARYTDAYRFPANPTPNDPTGQGVMASIGYYTSVAAINNENQLAGTYQSSQPLYWVPGPHHAFVGDVSAVSGGDYATPPGMKDLGTLGGLESYANAINDAGQVVGKADTAAGFSHAFLDTNGKMIDLGTLPGFSTSNALGLNDKGDVVGSSGGHAFVFSNGIMEDLNDRLPATSGITLDEADKINDAGQIIAYGHGSDGVEHGYLLSPAATPEPSTLALLGVAAAGYGAGRLRKSKK